MTTSAGRLVRVVLTAAAYGAAFAATAQVPFAMAVFLLKTEFGSGYTPPACQGLFQDVPCPSPFADWIEDLYSKQIAACCGNDDFCPNNPNTRGQMAVFLTKTFGLKLNGP